MKKLNLLMVLGIICLSAIAQEDSSNVVKKNDTVRIGNILIIKKGITDRNDSTNVVLSRKNSNSKISTNYFVFDFGFSNWDDQTNYAGTGGYLVNRPGQPALGASDFKLKNGKSINVNLWFFMQKLDLVKKNVSLKYGLGLELNNYRFKSPVSFKEGGTVPYSNPLVTRPEPFVFRDSISFSKNKLAADYVTVPVMLTFASNKAYEKKGISASAGVSIGYLYNSRNKQISDERGKEKNRGSYDLEKFKFSYIGELGIGPVKLYGSYSPNNMFEQGLDMRPYNIGIRFSNW